MSTRAGRVARGVAAAAIATLVAALSHTLGGGAAPVGVGTVIAFAFAVLVCIALAGRGISLWRISASVAVSQLAFHGLFSVVGTGPVPAAVQAGHHASAAAMMQQLGGAMPAHSGHDGAWMILAHVVAAVVTVLAIHRGEVTARAIGRLAVRAVRVLVPALPTLGPIVVGRLRAVGARIAPRDLGVVLSSMRHRGPPLAGALA